MADINIYINDDPVSVPEGVTILEASVMADQKLCHKNIEIPTLYYQKGLNNEDKSGVCIVEVEGEDALVPAETTTVLEGMKIHTDSLKVQIARKEVLLKIMASHNQDCINCEKNTACDLQHLYHMFGVDDATTLPEDALEALDLSSEVFVRDNNRCIRCGRCVKVCGRYQNVGAISMDGDGLDAHVGGMDNAFLRDFDFGFSKCTGCGQCVAVCPVGALKPRSHIDRVEAALKDPNQYVVAQVAPAVRASLGETFDFPIGTDVEKRIPAAIRALGFDAVFDTKFGADLTVVEEANELLERIKNGGTLPMITSCCPGWVKYCESFRPGMIRNLSTCKSPHMMEGAMIKSYFAEKKHLKRENITVVSVMPCTAKKAEISRPEMAGDVDAVLTTRELASMLKKAEIQLEAVPFESFDDPMGSGTGAAVIFGATGGVMEAALRTAANLLGDENASLEFKEVRGMDGVKEAVYTIGGKQIRAAVVSGLKNADDLLENVEKCKAKYDFIEVMACPGGCINGGGQPYQINPVQARIDVRGLRAAALYQNDANSEIRCAHENPDIKKLYDDYLGTYGSEKAHTLLHTSYQVR